VTEYERPMIELAKSPDFSTAALAELLKRDGLTRSQGSGRP